MPLRASLLVSVLLLVAACTVPDPPPAPSPPAPTPSSPTTTTTATATTDPSETIVLSQYGFEDDGLLLPRDVRGLSVTAVETALGTTVRAAPQAEDCDLGIPDSGAAVAVLLDKDMAVLGFVVESEQVRTPQGIGAGDDIDDVAAAYGEQNVAVLDAVTTRTGGPLVLVADQDDPASPPGPGTLHVGFDTDTNGVVTRIRAGYWPWVGYADYCTDESSHPERVGWPLTGAG